MSLVVVHPELCRLPAFEYEAAKSLLRACTLVPGEELGPWAWFVASGVVAVVDDSGCDALLASAGDVVDLTQGSAWLQAKIIARCEGLAYALDPAQVAAHAKTLPHLLTVLRNAQAGALASVMAAARLMRNGTPLARLARYLAQLNVVEVPFSQKELGVFTGLGHNQITALVARLEADFKVIKRAHGNVFITNRPKLINLANSLGG